MATSGAQICDFDDDDTSSEAALLASLGVFDASAGGSAADPEFPGRIECCSSKCALPEELLAGASAQRPFALFFIQLLVCRA